MHVYDGKGCEESQSIGGGIPYTIVYARSSDGIGGLPSISPSRLTIGREMFCKERGRE